MENEASKIRTQSLKLKGAKRARCERQAQSLNEQSVQDVSAKLKGAKQPKKESVMRKAWESEAAQSAKHKARGSEATEKHKVLGSKATEHLSVKRKALGSEAAE